MSKERLEENMELQERISSTKAEVKTFVNYRHKYITINVGYLLDIIEQAERALKNADDLHVMDLQLASEQKENKRYRRTLEFYADRKSWELGDPYEPRDCDAWRDQGRKARQALESESDE